LTRSIDSTAAVEGTWSSSGAVERAVEQRIVALGERGRPA